MSGVVEIPTISGAKMVMVGSRATCSPPPTDTDEDYLILVDDAEATVKLLVDMGFEYDREKYKGIGPLGFISLRFGDLNYIVTEDKDFFTNFLSATYLAKKFNLLEKSDRVELFNAVMGRASFADRVLPGWGYMPKHIFELAEKSAKKESEKINASNKKLSTNKNFMSIF